MQILLESSAIIAYYNYTDMNLLRGNAFNIWAGRKTRVHQTAGKTPAFLLHGELMKELSIFVDESGDFGEYDYHAPFYIISMVLHDQSTGIDNDLQALEN